MRTTGHATTPASSTRRDRDAGVDDRADARGRPGGLGPAEAGRWLWTQLTSMRTALVLLFLLALAAIPGGVIPQRAVSEFEVSDFKDANPALGEVYETLGMFNVYTSVWFSAIYLLLFISLIGCILPRIKVYARALRADPPPAPKRLDRLPESATVRSLLAPEDVLGAAEQHLRGKRFRVVRGPDAVSAERGYLREFGNLLFHTSAVVLLVGIAWNSLFGYSGTSAVVERQSFSNNLTQYDDFTAGGYFDDADLAPFSITLDEFTATFEAGPVQTGAAREFRADVTVVDEPGAEPHTETIEVNRPLHVANTQVHLVGHGYAPVVTVSDANGEVAFNGPVIFLPQDGNFTSVGAIKAPDARPERLGFQGFFLPTATVDEMGPRSVFPDALVPELFINAWAGPPRVETGEPESVYALDTEGMTQVTDAEGNPMTTRLSPGEYVDLPDGQGRLTFVGYQRWASLQVSHSPGLPLTVAAVAAAIIGLMMSLFVRPRRIWVRATREEADSTRVEIGGLDRADARTGLDEDVQSLLPVVDAGNEAREAGTEARTTGHDTEEGRS